MILGAAFVISVGGQSAATAQSVPGPYELYCPGTPVGNIALNNVTTSGTLSPSAPSPGQQFSVTGYQTTVAIPNSIVSAAAALGNSAITGSATTQVDATGATPAATPVGPLTINAPIPSPVPANGLNLSLPSTPETLGPFTATSSDSTISEDTTAQLTLIVSGSDLALTCNAYPNNSVATGIVSTPPAASQIAPVIATSGTTTTTSTAAPTTSIAAPTTSTTPTTTTAPPTTLTGAYELYCPATPVGNVVLNDAVTSATLTPAAPTSGQTFSLTGYQTVVNLPASLASAAAAIQPNLTGSATAQIDAGGATPATTSEGPLNFDVPIPSPVPDAGVSLSLPSTPATVSGFTATASAITIQEDASASLSLTVAGNALALTCTAYPNNSVTPSGITTDAPTASPIAPVIAVAGGGTASTTTVAPVTTTTATGTPTTTTTPGSSTTTTPPGGAVTTTTVALTTTTVVPTTTAQLCGAPANPFSYNYCVNGGALIYNPASGTCSYFQCIPNFSNGKGYMVECNDGTVSLSGGISGVCSDHEGFKLNVYQSTSTSSTTTSTSLPGSSRPPTTLAKTASTTARVVTASSHSLAFTGPGKGIQSMTLAGVVLMLLGLLMLILVDVPRRAVRGLLYVAPRMSMRRIGGRPRTPVTPTKLDVEREPLWLACDPPEDVR